MNGLDEKMEIFTWTAEEKRDLPPKYGCELLIADASMDQVKDSSFPSDAYLIYYKINENNYIDLCRGRRVNLFDLYYDKFGPGTIQKIDFGYGRVNPRLWGYKSKTDGKKSK